MTRTERKTTPRVIIYTRISKDQAADEHGVVNQLAACEKHAAARRWTVIARLSDNDLSATNGVHRPGYEQGLAMIAAGQADILLCWKVDRFVRRVRDLEDVIEVFEKAGAKLASVDGDLDLSTASGRLVGRMLAVVAKGEMESKGARQRLASEAAARDGQRWTGCPRPFGYDDDRVTPDPAEAAAVATACKWLTGGSTISAVAREWDRLGLRPPQAPYGPLPPHSWTRSSVTTILKNPRIAGLSVYQGEIVYGDDGEPVTGDWAPLVPAETWDAVRAILDDPDRKHPRGVRTLLGGLAVCRCGNVVTGSVNATGKHVYRCNPVTRDGRPGPHCQQMTGPVDKHVAAVVTRLLSRDDAADLITPPRPDTGPLHAEAAAIRRNLDELAADRALGLVSRSQMIAATTRGNGRLAEIKTTLDASAGQSALAPFAAAESARKVWEALDPARQRAVITALMTVTLLPAGRGSRVFDPDTVVTVPTDAI